MLNAEGKFDLIAPSHLAVVPGLTDEQAWQMREARRIWLAPAKDVPPFFGHTYRVCRIER